MLTDQEIDKITDKQWGVNPVYAAHRAYAREVEAVVLAKQGNRIKELEDALGLLRIAIKVGSDYRAWIDLIDTAMGGSDATNQ